MGSSRKCWTTMVTTGASSRCVAGLRSYIKLLVTCSVTSARSDTVGHMEGLS